MSFPDISNLYDFGASLCPIWVWNRQQPAVWPQSPISYVQNSLRIARSGLRFCDTAWVGHMVSRSTFEHRTHAQWISMARAEGIDLTAYAVSPVVTRFRGEDIHCVLHLVGFGREDLYLKRMFGPRATSRFHRTLEAHRAAAQALAGSPSHNAPRVLSHCEAGSALLLARVPGRLAQSCLEDDWHDPVARTETLAKCGAWLRDFHLARPITPRPCPTFEKLAGKRLRSGQPRGPSKAVANAAEFSHYLAVLNDLSSRVQNAPEPYCVIHGDFHAGNLLIAETTVSGIDFDNKMPGPSLADLATFLVTYSSDFGANTEFAKDWPASNMTAEAFFEAYGDRPDPELLAVHALHSVLQKWGAAKAEEKRRSAVSKRRFPNLMRLAEHLATRFAPKTSAAPVYYTVPSGGSATILPASRSTVGTTAFENGRSTPPLRPGPRISSRSPAP